MRKARTTMPPPAADQALVVPVSKPRNRLATHPLLRKSGTHADVRQKRNDQLDDRQRDAMLDIQVARNRQRDDT